MTPTKAPSALDRVTLRQAESQLDQRIAETQRDLQRLLDERETLRRLRASLKKAGLKTRASQPDLPPEFRSHGKTAEVARAVLDMEGQFTFRDIAEHLKSKNVTVAETTLPKIVQRLALRGILEVAQVGRGKSPAVYRVKPR